MPPQFPDTQIGDANTAAAEHQLYRSLRGYGWVSGTAATPVAGNTQVEVDSTASVWIDSTEVQVSDTGNVADVSPHGDYPRWATIVVEDTGNVTAVMGEVNRPVELDDGTRLTGRQAPRPQPPVITDPTQVVYAFVWVPANASEIQADHVVDRRIDARVDAYNFTPNQYSDADAIAAAEGEDPFDHAGDVNVGGNMDVTGSATVQTDLNVDRNVNKRNDDGDALRLQTHDNDQGDGSGALQTRLLIEEGSTDTTSHFFGTDKLHVTSLGSHTHFEIEGASDSEARIQFSPNHSETWRARALSDTADTFAFVEHSSGNLRQILAMTPSSVDVHNDASFQHGGDDVVVSSAGDYDIQKDGTDGTGVINFSTTS